MRVAYIVLCHKEPDQVARLVGRLTDESSRIWLHVDARADDVARCLRTRLTKLKNVSFTTRTRVYWGSWNVVRATLIALRAAAGSGWPFDYAILLSGQDYPVVGPAQIRERLEAAGGKSFIDCRDLEATWPLAFNRTVQRHMTVPSYGLRRLDWLPARRPPHAARLYGGSTWWALSHACVDYLLDPSSPSRALARYMRASACPDEAFFQTALMNSDQATCIENWCPTYVDWRPSDLSHPATLTSDDFEAIIGSGCLLARKFDVSVDARILDMLDDYARYEG
jgi:hypothetical protein